MNRTGMTGLLVATMVASAAACGGPPHVIEPGPVAGSSATVTAMAPAVGAVSDAVAAVAPAAVLCHRVVVAAGDIVNNVTVANRTGTVAAAQHPHRVLVLGDNQYPSGSLADYRTKYDRTRWGTLKPLTKPVPGNHEYGTSGASGYYAYFGRPPAYYAYNLGCGWRAYALNSEIPKATQLAWLRRDLALHPGAAVVAYWHKPRWSSGAKHGNNARMQPFWDALAGRRGVVLNGHDHDYERFAPIRGLREFVVGTGGSSSTAFGTPVAGSQRRVARTPGILRLDLSSHAAYGWSFVDVHGRSVDRGSA